MTSQETAAILESAEAWLTTTDWAMKLPGTEGALYGIRNIAPALADGPPEDGESLVHMIVNEDAPRDPRVPAMRHLQNIDEVVRYCFDDILGPGWESLR